MDVHEREARRLIAGGADPRRAGPVAAAHFDLPRTLTAAQTMAVGGLIGTLATVAVASVLALAFGLHVTSGTIPQAESPAKAEIEAALSPVPVEQRSAVLADLVRVTVMLRDPVALTVVRAIRDLSEQDRVALAQSTRLKAVLAWMASFKADQQTALLATDLRPILGDPDRLALLQLLPQLDPLSAQVLADFKYANFTRRQTLMAVLTLIANDDGRFDRLIAAFSNAAPSLVKLLDGRLVDCQFSNRGACR